MIVAQVLIDDAAVLFGDPLKQRVKPAEWLAILNRVLRKLSMRMNVLEVEALFDVTVADHRFAWPEDATQVRSIATTTTPSDQASFGFLDELVEEEWRAKVGSGYPVGTPTHYFARQGWFHLYPWPDVEYLNGGLIAYWALHPKIGAPGTEFISYPDMSQDHIVDGMLVQAAMRDKQIAEARAMWEDYMAHVDELKFRVEDRSDDRRPSIRPRVAGSIGAQV